MLTNLVILEDAMRCGTAATPTVRFNRAARLDFLSGLFLNENLALLAGNWREFVFIICRCFYIASFFFVWHQGNTGWLAFFGFVMYLVHCQMCFKNTPGVLVT